MKSAPFVLLLFVLTLSPGHAQLIVAHRGASHDASENTLAAFRLAWEQNADAAEADFRITRDGHIVCIHDETTKRTGGRELKVATSTLAELRQLEYGAWKHEQFEGEPLPTLAEMMREVPPDKRFFLEIKTGPEIVPALFKEIEQSSLRPEQITLIAFDAEVIGACKKAMPHLKAYWLTSFKQDRLTRAWKPKLSNVLETLKRIQADGLDCKAEPKVVDQDFVNAIRSAGFELHCWTVNDPALAKQFQELGFDSITTDRPAYLRKALGPE